MAPDYTDHVKQAVRPCLGLIGGGAVVAKVCFSPDLIGWGVAWEGWRGSEGYNDIVAGEKYNIIKHKNGGETPNFLIPSHADASIRHKNAIWPCALCTIQHYHNAFASLQTLLVSFLRLVSHYGQRTFMFMLMPHRWMHELRLCCLTVDAAVAIQRNNNNNRLLCRRQQSIRNSVRKSYYYRSSLWPNRNRINISARNVWCAIWLWHLPS